MPDTIKSTLPDVPCDDCGVRNVIFQHWGPLVPVGIRGRFCEPCMQVRAGRSNKNQPALPLGQTDYTERCTGKFALLQFPDMGYPRELTPVSTRELAEHMTRELGFPVGHMEGSVNLCEFIWEQRFEESHKTKVNSYLNEVRRQYPLVAISGRGHSSIPLSGC